PRRAEAREQPAGRLEDLEGPDRAAGVRRVDVGGRLGVDGLQPGVERQGSLLLRLPFQSLPHHGIGAGELQRIDDRTEVQAGHATSSPSRWWGAAAVMRTRANMPSWRASAGLGTWTSLLVRVRVVALPGSLREGPSTSTSSSPPT